MRNTGIEYGSDERKPVVLPELAELLPSLAEEQLEALENDLLANGCYSPIIVNEDFAIVDGHNRQRLCEQHGIPYRMMVFAFEDMLEAKQWALDTQKGRRNLDKWELGKIALKLKPDVEARARANMSAGGGDQSNKGDGAGCLNSDNPLSETVDTRNQLADTVGIGRDTMSRIMKIDENAPDVVKEALDKKELSVNQGYNITKQVQELPEEERDEAAAIAVEVEKAKKELREKDAELERRTKLAKLFSKAFEVSIQLKATEENVRIWTECARMVPGEIEETAGEARELSGRFAQIAEHLDALAREAAR